MERLGEVCSLGSVNMRMEPVARHWRCTPLIPALRRQRQVDVCESEASLVYRASSRTGSKATRRNPVLKP